MANEFKHKDPGGELTQAEFIAACGDGHIFACQATGDIVYASSATVLSKLAKGNQHEILSMGGSNIPAWTASPSVTDLTIGGGCITLTGAATDIDLIDNNASALSFDATGKAGIIAIVTTDCSEGVTMSGTLGVTGVLTATGGLELSHATANTLTASSGVLSIEGNRVFHAGGTDIPVADGGTGASTFTANGILVGNGTSAVAVTATMATKGHVMVGDGSGVPTMLAVGSNCQVLTACSSEATGTKWAAGGGAVSAVANGADNRIATFSSSTALNGEANLTFSTDLSIASGNVVIATAGKGIDFSAQTQSTSYTASDEVLQHYEEGSWTPVISDTGSTVSENQSYNTQAGTYTRIGDMVSISGHLDVNSIGCLSGGATIHGLPFAAKASSAPGTMSFAKAKSMDLTAGYNLGGDIPANTSYISIQVWDAAAGTTDLSVAEYSAGGEVQFGGVYHTAS